MEIIKIYILINAHMVSAVAVVWSWKNPVVWWLGVRICVKSVYTSTGWAQGYRDTGAGDQGGKTRVPLHLNTALLLPGFLSLAGAGITWAES